MVVTCPRFYNYSFMRYLYTVTLLILLASPVSAHFQGRVVDKNNRGISDAFVLRNAHGGHIHTDFEGNFTLPDARIGDTLLVNAIGSMPIVSTQNYGLSLSPGKGFLKSLPG